MGVPWLFSFVLLLMFHTIHNISTIHSIGIDIFIIMCSNLSDFNYFDVIFKYFLTFNISIVYIYMIINISRACVRFACVRALINYHTIHNTGTIHSIGIDFFCAKRYNLGDSHRAILLTLVCNISYLLVILFYLLVYFINHSFV